MNVSHTEKLIKNFGAAMVIMNNRVRVLGFIALLTCFSGAASAACEREIDTASREHLVANKGRDGSTGDFPNFRSWLIGHFDFFRKNPNTSELKNLPDFWKKDIQDQELKRLPTDFMQHLRSQNAAITCILLSVLDARNSGDIPPKNQSVQQPRESQPRTNQQQAQQSSQQNQPTGLKENCEALFTAERRQRLSGPQYAQEYTDCLGRILARSKVQTAAPVVAPTTQDAQQQAQQSQQVAAQNQTRAEQARQGQRKTHDPAAEAHECVAIDNAGSGNFGAFKNICGYKVNFLTCNYKPRVIQGGFNWSADFDCEQQKFGLHTPDGGRAVAAHNRNTELVYWFACKAPAGPVDLTFVSGEGIKGRCYTVGGK